MDIPGVPRLPTDNLYKFVALSGLVVFLVCLILPWLGLFREWGAADALDQDSRLAEFRLTVLSERINSLSPAIEAGRRDSAIVARVESNGVQLRREREAAVLLRTRTTQIREEIGLLQSLTNVCVVFGTFGLGWSIWGFWRWYTKLQKPLDEIVRRRAEDLRRAATEAESPS